jgi:secretion/DNA translocation related TadE-like protein
MCDVAAESGRDVDRERGSGTVLAVGLIGVIATLLVAGLLVAAVAIAGQRARTAADLAALAAAGAAVTGGDVAASCRVAQELAARNGAVLTACTLVHNRGDAGEDAALPAVDLTVTRAVGGTGWTVTARSRAGGVPPP